MVNVQCQDSWPRRATYPFDLQLQNIDVCLSMQCLLESGRIVYAGPISKLLEHLGRIGFAPRYQVHFSSVSADLLS